MMLIRTRHDLTTEYTYAYSELVKLEAERWGVEVHCVEGGEASFKNFEKRIAKVKPSFVFFNGHGTKDAFLDNQGKELVNSAHCSLFQGTVVFARSCDSLSGLGIKAVQAGCKAFIGYRKKFIIPRWHKKTCLPLQDEAARPILQCSNQVSLELLKGKTVEVSVQKSHELADKHIVDIIYSSEPYAGAALFALSHNDDNLGFEGEGNAVI